MFTRPQLLIIGIITVVVSIAFLLINYFGIDRWFGLQFSSKNDQNKIIENYSTKPNLLKSDKKIVVLVDKLQDKNIPMLMSILDQTHRVSQISMFLPYAEQQSVPETVKSIVSIFPATQSGNSLFHILQKERDSDTIIVYLKNNVIYGQDFIKSFINDFEQNSDVPLESNDSYALAIKPNHVDDVSYWVPTCCSDSNIEQFTSKSRKQSHSINNENYRY